MVRRKSSILVWKVLINWRWQLRLLVHAFSLHFSANCKGEVGSGCHGTACIRTCWGPHLRCQVQHYLVSLPGSLGMLHQLWNSSHENSGVLVSFLQSLTGEDTKCLHLNSIHQVSPGGWMGSLPAPTVQQHVPVAEDGQCWEVLSLCW